MAIEYKNTSEGEYDLLIYGEIGEEVTGSQVADAVAYLNRCGAKKIRERINSVGGSVVDAYAIIAANVDSTALIETVNEGIADSCGFWVLTSGNKGNRKALDYSSSLIHNPSVNGVSLDDMPDGKKKNELTIIRDSIAKIVSNNTGQSEEFIKELMSKSERLTAKQLKEYGFVDEIVSSENKPKITSNMSALEIMNVCKASNNSQTEKKESNMELINQFLGLNKDATENSALAEFKSRENKLNADILAANNKATQAEQERDKYKADLEAANQKLKEVEKAGVEAAVNSAIESGKFNADQKENLISTATNMGLSAFNFMVSAMATPAADLAGRIQNNSAPQKGNDDEAALAKAYDDAWKNNTLDALKNANPTKFAQMEAAWTKSTK